MLSAGGLRAGDNQGQAGGGKELAAVVPIEDVKLLEELEDRLDLEVAREALKEEGTIAWEKVKAELGL